MVLTRRLVSAGKNGDGDLYEVWKTDTNREGMVYAVHVTSADGKLTGFPALFSTASSAYACCEKVWGVDPETWSSPTEQG